ncbi:unnamed protein product [Rotaria sp. Silwood2]|nr:unnamed protein product [Rotaria sp. Silwood2]CAF2771573.1 unnamed protein product [Rotaria sp. Silwood2]CAF3198974.1 unnamed protein product [Rotaria sp. Silwood2]CAF4083418.1 unnamed protein product [Rotaria sp. Silwood2]CAF4283432.1 unnamed protein product [Rotaria sp. Silwood2]
MTSSTANLSQLQKMDNTRVLSNLVSSTIINPLTTNSDPLSIIAQSLPASLAAPSGWQSEIIHSKSPISIDNKINQIHISNSPFSNSAQGYYTANTNNTPINDLEQDFYTTDKANILVNNYQETCDTNTITEIPINITPNKHEYTNFSIINNAINQPQTILTEQQKQHIIQNVELQEKPPIIIRRKLQNPVTYKQNISVRYLKPPTPPPAGPLIIREIRPPPPPPLSPIQIRQRPPPPPSPSPIILRERPPSIPPRLSETVIEKVLPPPPRPPRRVVVERFGPCPPKPSDVIIERWLPYKQSNQRPIFIERAPPPCMQPQEPNLLVLHDSPSACIRKEFINDGIVRADPYSYIQRYGAELNASYTNPRFSYLVNEATRAVPPPPVTSIDHRYQYDGYDRYYDKYQRVPSPHIINTWERTRYEPSITRSSSYRYDYSDYDDSPYKYCTQSSRRYGPDPCRYYDDYCERRGSYVTMTDVTPSWNRYCNSSPYDPCLSSYDRYASCYDPCRPSYYRSSLCYDPCSSYCPPKTIRVCSDNELRDVLCNLTNGRVPPELRSY